MKHEECDKIERWNTAEEEVETQPKEDSLYHIFKGK